MADGKNLMEERKKMKMILFKALNLKLNSKVEASNNKQRARTCHKRNSNPLNIKSYFQLIFYSTTTTAPLHTLCH